MISAALVGIAIGALLPQLNPARVGELSESIAAVADTPDDAARLVVTVARETGGIRSYETCARVGAAGEVSGFQIRHFHFGKHTRAEICSDPQLAASIALGLLQRRKSALGAFALYLGRRGSDSECITRLRLYDKAIAAMGAQTS